MINLGIDITSLLYNRGVSRYTSNLVRELNHLSHLKLHLLGYSLRNKNKLIEEINAIDPSLKKQSQLLNVPPSLMFYAWKLGFLSIQSQFKKINVFHSWDYLQPPDKQIPLVSTIHDLAMIKFPHTAHPKILKYHENSWKILKKRNAQIIAVSKSTKKDIINYLQIDPQNVTVIYEALPSELVKEAEKMTDEVNDKNIKKLKIDKPYLLFVGTTEPRKNLNKIIEAWKPLAKDYELIIAGASGWDTINQSLNSTQEKNLRFMQNISFRQLITLYSQAELLVYPSLYEGFGLPILEAFYFGTPVVTSNVSSMPEVAGNAAELVDPSSVTAIRKGISNILNENEKESKKRIQKMIIRLQMFDWHKTAIETKKVYMKAIEQA